jgi:gliding motility-associated protein GldL
MLKKKKINWLHIAISWGASIVILGAMFKINHWGGQLGTYMIGLGLSVEAMLFFTLGFFPPAEEPEWEKVYPELAVDYDGEPAPKGLRKVYTGNGTTAALDGLLTQVDLSPEKINNLGEGLKQFSDKMGKINAIADASLGTDEFSAKLKNAASKFDLLGIMFEKASAGFATISDSRDDALAYQQQVLKLTHNLAHLNSLYESELHGADTNLRRINQFYQGLTGTLNSLHESAGETRVFKDEVNKLVQNISSLNVYYANMLSAMNQQRG